MLMFDVDVDVDVLTKVINFDSNRKNVENGGAHTPTASSAPSELETFMRLLYLTTIVVNFWETVFPQFFFQEAIFPHFQEAVFPQISGSSIPSFFLFVVVARLTSGNHQQVPLQIQLSLSHKHYFIWSMCPYRKCADIRGDRSGKALVKPLQMSRKTSM
jgi:hypothetical protein